MPRIDCMYKITGVVLATLVVSDALAGADRLIGAVPEDWVLLAIDVETGSEQPAYVVPFGERVRGLAFAVETQRLYGVASSGSLLAWDRGDLGFEFVGVMDIDSPSCAAFDPSGSHILVGDFGGELFTVDAATAESTPIGMTGIESLSGLSFSPTTGELWGVSRTEPGSLYRIDPVDGQAIAVASTRRLDGITFAPDGSLLGVADGGLPSLPSRLYEIDLSDGSSSQLSVIDGVAVHGLLFERSGVLPTRNVSWTYLKAIK